MELKKFATEEVETEEQCWPKLFTEGERLDDANLPEWMQTVEMRQAMSTPKGMPGPPRHDRAIEVCAECSQFFQEWAALHRG
jgi:hypothetical protein